MALNHSNSQLSAYQKVLEDVQKQHGILQQHALDALLYGQTVTKASMYKDALPKTPKQLAMMGTYNQRSPDEDFYIKLLGMRLRVKEGEMIPFDYIGCHHDTASGDVHLMIVRNNTAVTFQESGAIFPSDETIAQLNMIINK